MSADTQKNIKIPYDWLKKVSAEALANDEIPLFGSTPSFSWENLIEYLKSKLHIENLKISRSNITQKTEEELLAGIGAPYRIHAIAVAPIDETILFVMSEQEIAKLLSALLTPQETPLHLENDFISPFFTFMAVEGLNAINKIDFDPNLTFTLDNTPDSLPSSICHCFNLTIEINHTHVMGRIIIPPKFRHAWKSYYTPKNLMLSLDSQLAQNIDMIVHIEAGRVQMNLTQWKSVQPGDFINLDSCTLEPSGLRGKIRMTVDGNMLFRGKLKDGNIKILENPLYHEDLTPMPNKKIDNDDEENVDFSDADTEFTDDDSEITESEDSDNFDTHEEEELLSEVEGSQIEDEDEDENSKHFENDHFNEDADEEETHHDKQTSFAESSSKSREHSQMSSSSVEERIQSRPLPSSKPLAPHEIPLDIVVEVGRIRMSIQKIMELQPGNMLELDVHPENGVDLVVNGQKIAKAELLLLGDHLGVRIIDIG